ncbi:MAG: DUF1992 domain-containing protein [Gammaproteobacteria bacterium]|nr:DUF1992 domain-containing protein [Gammaproteobacteria bacterium]
MLYIDRLAEEQIEAAIRRGELDDLPGQGQRLDLDDERVIPEALRVAYRVLKNAGCLPPEFGLRSEIRELEGLLHQVEVDTESQALRRRLSLLKTRLALQGRELHLSAQEGAYRQKLLDRLAADKAGKGVHRVGD